MPITPSQILIQNLSKSFSGQTLFQNLNLSLSQGDWLAITGTNGSGKSTFLKVLVGKMKPDKGNIHFYKDKKLIPTDCFYQHIAWDTPELTLYPYFNIHETYYWHFQFFQPLLELPQWIEALQLEPHQNKPIKYLSSGTLQRIKVGLALFSNTPMLALDEPTANMDNENAKKMIDLIYAHSKNRILAIASNLHREIEPIVSYLNQTCSSEMLQFSLLKTQQNDLP